MLGSKRQKPIFACIREKRKSIQPTVQVRKHHGSGGAISLLAQVCDGNTTVRLLALLSLGSLSG